LGVCLRSKLQQGRQTMKKIIQLLAAALISSSAIANDYLHCNSLMQHGITNISKTKSNSHAIAYKWHKYCGEDYLTTSDNRAREASASIFGFEADGTSNSTHTKSKINKWCSANQNFAESKYDLYLESREISDPALKAWTQCKALASKGLNIDVAVQGEHDGYLDFSIDSTSDGTYLFFGLAIVGYTCQIETADGTIMQTEKISKSEIESLLLPKDRPRIDHRNIHIACRRNAPEIKEENGVGTILYPEGHISVMTSASSLPLTFAKVVSDYKFTPPKSVIAFASDDCPKGWKPYEKAQGRFIRGLNPNGTVKLEELQEDSVGKHSHEYTHAEPVHYTNQDEHGGKHKRFWQEGGLRNIKTRSNPQGETRPKNVTLNYCIKAG
jgi:hypothetical protein